MYLSQLQISNFRIFGDGDHGLDLVFQPGLTLLVGPNDGGKSAIVDAIRLALGTTTRDAHRVVEDDFHYSGTEQASSFKIVCRFDFPDPDEAAPFFEFITPEASRPVLYIAYSAIRLPDQPKRGIVTDIRTGPTGSGPRPDGTMRTLMAATYLRALRDALHELTAGRGSRLSQILHAHPEYQSQKISDFDDTVGIANLPGIPRTLVGIMRLAEHAISENSAVQWTRNQLNQKYLDHLSLATEPITGDVGITRSAELRDILEKLDLWISSIGQSTQRTKRGLGTNNILYMASELLLIGASGEDGLPLLMIEEPEAHLHPQLQLLVGDFLHEQSAASSTLQPNVSPTPLQIIATTHSPTLASQVQLEQLVMVIAGKAFPLRKGDSALDPSDYRFLSKFLNATRANLFFAHGVMIVEGDAENLLLPVLADLLDAPLNKHGVSIVNVGTVGLFRYSRIFQSIDRNERVPVRIACVTDLDLPQSAADELKERRRKTRQRNDGGTVKTFVSPVTTLEYDLAAGSFAREMHLAIALAINAKSTGAPVMEQDRTAIMAATAVEFTKLQGECGNDVHALAERIYAPLTSVEKTASKPETAQYFAEILTQQREAGTLSAASLRDRLPPYLVDAIYYVTRKRRPPPLPPKKSNNVAVRAVG